MATAEQAVAPLQAGDKLSREEFLRRWEMHPEIKRAELIGGIVYMPSPVSAEHGDNENTLTTWLGVYHAWTPGCVASNNATTLLRADAPQADGHLRLLPECGGKSRVQGVLLQGPPELAGEMCRSSVSYDLHQKFDLYEAAGVQEYVAVLLFEKEIRWYQLVRGSYQLLLADEDGVWRSRVFPGLWLDGEAMLQNDAAGVLATLQKGIDSPAHRAFVEELARRRRAHGAGGSSPPANRGRTRSTRKKGS